MIKIGITGQKGFIGTHLYNTIGLEPDKFQRVPFEGQFFKDNSKLKRFVSQCDVIVHLAALNRHSDPQIIYDTNMDLLKRLIGAMETTNSRPHVLFASSTQEERDDYYGRSKKQGRIVLEQWASQNQARFTGLIIPNVFGPFGQPYYNSVVATFCHQLTNGEHCEIQVDSELKFIYVAELVQTIINHITASKSEVSSYQVPHTATIKVSQLLDKLTAYKQSYFDKQIIPEIQDPFDWNLFNTFVSYIDHESFYPQKLVPHTDQRGSFVEVLKLDNTGGQVSFSTTIPGITRGNHFHIKKFERFAVIKGRARIDIRRVETNKVLSFVIDGKAPAFVDMPIWYTHNITNIGDEELYTLFWISEFFEAKNSDTYFLSVS
jgi:UDP-2-acetamido-2,6-beta-L-arabino-hexul-4-ose reductase